MARTVFWSWQSDRPGKVNRHFLKDVVSRALGKVAEDMDLEQRPEIDHDVLGAAGLVSIPETILRKIDKADVFVADLTPVAVTERGKYVANPNVLIELGYAKRALGPERVILIWNSAWGGCEPEDLPFDLRHRRAPFRYELGVASSRQDREVAALTLIPQLASAISASLSRVPAGEPPTITRTPSRQGDASVWFPENKAMTVLAGLSTGPTQVVAEESARSYLRIAPSAWLGERLEGLKDGRLEIPLLGDTMGMSVGRTKGGVLAFESDERRDGVARVTNAAQWFTSNGEIWGFDGRITHGIDEKHAGIAVDYVIQCWMRFLSRCARTFSDRGAKGPFEIEAGVNGFEDLHWKRGAYAEPSPAIEDVLACRKILPALDAVAMRAFVREAANDLAHAYGKPPFTEDQFDTILSDPRAEG